MAGNIDVDTIFLDQDMVLADFYTSAKRAHGITEVMLKPYYEPGNWCLLKPFGEASGLERPLTMDEFWEPIHEKEPEFWMEMGVLNWFDELVALVKEKSKHWYVVTTPSNNPMSLYGKKCWLDAYVEDFACSQFIPTFHKHLLAKPNTILIDDNEDTVKRFIIEGGHGILYPQLSNRLYEQANDPIPHVTRELEKIQSHIYPDMSVERVIGYDPPFMVRGEEF